MTKDRERSTLRIYVAKHCSSCEEALRLAEKVQERFVELNVELIDLEVEGSVNYDNVFSTPTYVFKGRTISLGNPSAEELFVSVSALLAQ